MHKSLRKHVQKTDALSQNAKYVLKRKNMRNIWSNNFSNYFSSIYNQSGHCTTKGARKKIAFLTNASTKALTPSGHFFYKCMCFWNKKMDDFERKKPLVRPLRKPFLCVSSLILRRKDSLHKKKSKFHVSSPEWIQN